MKIIINLVYFVILLTNCCCSRSKLLNDDVSCLRQINTDISKNIRNQIGNEYNSKQNSIKLILQFYTNSKSKTDSIIIAKSNLTEIGIDEKTLVRNLKLKRYSCIRKVYYSKELKPNYIVVVFNPKLIN